MITDYYTDEEIKTALYEARETSAVKLFFKKAQNYATKTWQKKYTHLREEDWKHILCDVNFKFVSRFRKGLTLQAGTKLASYYTTLTKYAILDFIEQRQQKRLISPLEDVAFKEVVLPANNLEELELAVQIRNMLRQITKNEEQVKVLLLRTQGFTFKEIAGLTSYKNDKNCRNASLRARAKITEYFLEHPAEGKLLRALLLGKI